MRRLSCCRLPLLQSSQAIYSAASVTSLPAIAAELLGDLQSHVIARHRCKALGRFAMWHPSHGYPPSLQSSQAICNAMSLLAIVIEFWAIYSVVSSLAIAIELLGDLQRHSSRWRHQCPSMSFCPRAFIHRLSFIAICSLPFILIDALYSSNCMYYVHVYLIPYSSNHIQCFVFFYKILGHGKTPCPQMMRTNTTQLELSISYGATYSHLSQFL